MRKKALIVVVALAAGILAGCVAGGTGGDNSGQSEQGNQGNVQPSGSPGAGQPYTDGWGLLTDDFFDEFVQRFEQVESKVADELEDRRSAQPKHYGIGEEAQITGNLAVRIDAVENGPYDYADRTPTVKVTATMRNLSDHTVWVKPSNFDADSADGRRLDHKVYIKGADGSRDVRSFYPTKISPGASYTGEMYFDGDVLESVVYIPHFVTSSENQYVYFDL